MSVFMPVMRPMFETGGTPGVLGTGTRSGNVAQLVRQSRAGVRAVRAGAR